MPVYNRGQKVAERGNVAYIADEYEQRDERAEQRIVDGAQRFSVDYQKKNEHCGGYYEGGNDVEQTEQADGKERRGPAEFDYKKYEDMAQAVGKTFEYLPMKLSERQLGFMNIMAKTYGEALLIDYAMRNGKAVAESDEIYKITGRVLLKNSDKIIRCARKGVSEGICIHSVDLLKIFPCCKHYMGYIIQTVFFKVTKADYFAVLGKDIDYYENLLATKHGKYLIIERLWYELAKENRLKIYGFKCYPDLSGNRGSVDMAYDKNKVGLFFRNILCKFGYYSLKS